MTEFFVVMDDSDCSPGPFASFSFLNRELNRWPLGSQTVKAEGISLRNPAIAVTKNDIGLLNASIIGGSVPAPSSGPAFPTVEADWTIKQSVVHVQRMLLDSYDFQATTEGRVGFDQRLELKASLSLSLALSLGAGSSSVATLGMNGGRRRVFLLIGGTNYAPTFALDAEALGGRVREKVQETVREQTEKFMKGKAGEKVKKGADALQRLFGP